MSALLSGISIISCQVSYIYTRLSEAMQTVGTGKVVNIYAVVTDFEQPRKTSGTDNSEPVFADSTQRNLESNLFPSVFSVDYVTLGCSFSPSPHLSQ